MTLSWTGAGAKNPKIFYRAEIELTNGPGMNLIWLRRVDIWFFSGSGIHPEPGGTGGEGIWGTRRGSARISNSSDIDDWGTRSRTG